MQTKLAHYRRLVVVTELLVNHIYTHLSRYYFFSIENRTVLDLLVGSFVLLTVVFKSSAGSGLMTPATSLFIAAMNSAWLYEYSTGRSPRTNSPPAGKRVREHLHHTSATSSRNGFIAINGFIACVLYSLHQAKIKRKSQVKTLVVGLFILFFFGSDITSLW